MSGIFVIARTYATAIFDIAVAQKNISKWKSVLNLFVKVSQHSLVQSLLHRCLVSERLSDIFLAICEDYQHQNQIDVCSRNLIRVLAENNRLLLLPVILKEFNYLHDKFACIVEIEVISAWPLQRIQLKKIIDLMTRRLSKTVKVVNNVDKYILGGIIIRIGDIVIDGSIRGRIARLNGILQF